MQLKGHLGLIMLWTAKSTHDQGQSCENVIYPHAAASRFEL